MRSYFRDVAAALIVYDMTNPQSFERITDWFQGFFDLTTHFRELTYNSTTSMDKIGEI